MNGLKGKRMLDLRDVGLSGAGRRYHNLNVPNLVECAIKAGDALLSDNGALVVNTGKYTGRSPDDKFIVRDVTTEKSVNWGKINQPITRADADQLYDQICSYLKDRDLFVQDCFAGANIENRLAVRVICERAWHALFAQNMFIEADAHKQDDFAPNFTVVHAPGFKAIPGRDQTRSEVAVILDFEKRRIFICGTEYAGEIKKSVFSVMNHVLADKNILGMHCSANVGQDNDVAIFFGLSGTGKTTLSADPHRRLIGDDEHGWCDDGVFNFEGGCYAKVIRLSEKDEPEIFSTTRLFGTVLENVVIDLDRRSLDLDSDRYTENTRASYSISRISNADLSGHGGHPRNIVMLTCDAFGVLPPLARLSPAQAMYHFISGYTARVAGTERGVKEPSAVFSSCFGAPFMTRFAGVYAKLLGDRMAQHEADCWLVNTGWYKGPYGVGERMKIAWTRRLIDAALGGELKKASYVKDERFGFEVPTHVTGVPDEVLTPIHVWPDAALYEQKADELASLFIANFRAFEDDVEEIVRLAGPKLRVR
jgi:phosphoenolpyruvate carboxykinase (ATP)